MSSQYPVASSDLLETFLQDAGDALASFASTTYHLQHERNADAVRELGIVSHRLRGAAALCGFPQMSRLASMIERLTASAPRLGDEEFNSFVTFTEQVAAILNTALARVAANEAEGDLGLELAEIGGTEVLMHLLRANPQAFVQNSAAISTQDRQQVEDAKLTEFLRKYYRENQEDWEFFAPEVLEHVETVQDILANQNEDSLSEENITQLFRSMHTIKGASYMVDLRPLGDLAHRLEDLMDRVRSGTLPFDKQVSSSLRSGAKAIEQHLYTAEGRNVGLEHSLATLREALAGLEPDPKAEQALVNALQRFAEAEGEGWEELDGKLRAQIRRVRDLLNNSGFHDAPALYAEVQDLRADVAGTAEPIETLVSGLEQLLGALNSVSASQWQSQLDALQQVTEQALILLEHFLGLADLPAADGDGSAQELRRVLQEFSRLMHAAKPGSETVTLTALAPQAGAEPVLAGQNTQTQSGGRSGNTLRVRLDRLNSLMGLAGEMVDVRARLEHQIGQFGEIRELLELSQGRLMRAVTDLETQYLNPRLSSLDQRKQTSQEASEARMQFETFAELELDTYSDLNIFTRSVTEMATDLSEIQLQLNQALHASADELDALRKLSRSIRSEVSRTRMVPIGTLFTRLRRLLQDDARKSFRVVMSGEATEIDNVILEGIADPLLHLVKNALAHGIEPRNVREERGKDPSGTVALRAHVEGNQVVIEVEDDGAGIDSTALRNQAVLRGFRHYEEVDAMSEHEALRLMFIPGLSTAKSISSDAGRGVGMDVVASEIETLNGEINVYTRLGQGSRFEMRLPLTLVVSEALQVRAGGTTFGFAIDVIGGLTEVSRDHVTLGHISYAGEDMPLYALTELLHLRESSENEGEILPAVILNARGKNFAVAVDSLLEIEEAVLRPLGHIMNNIGYLAGATTSSTGNVILLLDPPGLAALLERAPAAPSTTDYSAITVAPSRGAHDYNLLLVDDSVSVRRVVSKMLERAGYRVTTAADGQVALDLILEGNSYDAVLTDLEMPRMNGFELIESLRRRPESATLPICVMTTRAGEKHSNLAFSLGANAYLTKPIDEGRLLGFLDKTLVD